MSYPRQFREEVIQEFGFLNSGRPEEPPLKRPQSSSRSPAPNSRVSSKQQLEKLKSDLDLETQQKRVEEFKKKAMEDKRIMSKELEHVDNIQSTPNFAKLKKDRRVMSNELEAVDSVPGTPDFGMLKKKAKRLQTVRTDFPNILLAEFPFLNSPDEYEDVSSLFKLTDERYGPNEVQDIICRVANRKN